MTTCSTIYVKKHIKVHNIHKDHVNPGSAIWIRHCFVDFWHNNLGICNQLPFFFFFFNSALNSIQLSEIPLSDKTSHNETNYLRKTKNILQ